MAEGWLVAVGGGVAVCDGLVLENMRENYWEKMI